MIQARRRARQALVQAVYQWQLSGQNLSEIDAQFAEEHAGSKTDMEYFRENFFGLAKNLDVVDAALLPCLERSIDEVNPVERAVLRLGVYELIFRPDLHYRIVLNESIDLAKRFGADQGHRYVNGVLDCAAKTLRANEFGQTRPAN